jgi:hypothetical protein
MRARIPKILFILAVIAMMPAPSWASNIIYQQPFDQTGNAYSSQNDTNGLGNFATVYDNFKLGSSYFITEVQWTGEYFNPPNQGPITGWTITFYADNAGQPGSPLPGGIKVAGTGGETFLGNFGGFPTYTYDVVLTIPFAAAAGTQYWLAVVPDLHEPPQWGWSSGTGGDGISYEDFFGVRTQLAADMAFGLSAGCCCCGVPEPGTLLMVGSGAVGAGVYYADVLGLPALGLLRRWRRKFE